MRLVVAIIFLVASCGGTADGPNQTADMSAPVITEAPVSTASTAWEEFTGHVDVSANEMTSIASGFASIETFDPDAIDAQAQKLQRWADSETEWLDTHPSDPCYTETYGSWSSGVTLYGQTAKLFREAIAERNTTKLTQGDEAMTQGNAEFQKMLDSKPTSEAACATSLTDRPLTAE